MISNTNTLYTQAINEIESFPVEYIPNLLKIIKLYKDSLINIDQKKSFATAWKESQEGMTLPLESLWEDIEFS